MIEGIVEDSINQVIELLVEAVAMMTTISSLPIFEESITKVIRISFDQYNDLLVQSNDILRDRFTCVKICLKIFRRREI